MIHPTVTTRFAPSPTGYLHLGHIFAAKVAHDLARSRQGDYLLRLEDIDTTRTREYFYQAILEDLEWLGIHHDHPPIRQTDRFKEYDKAIEKLKNLGVLYPCFCTRKDIANELSYITNAPHEPEGSLYPQICRSLCPDKVKELLKQGNVPSWRLNSDKVRDLTPDLKFEDEILGHIKVNHDLLGDVILARKDIGTSYHVAVVVDDAFQKITHVTRGEDLLTSTHIHTILQRLLLLPQPVYHHHQLIKDSNDERLAKRNAPLSVKQLRRNGHSATEVIALVYP